jgi:hypothetical protein
MNNCKHASKLAGCIRGGILVLTAISVTSVSAATLWTGPNINFTQTANKKSDVILASKVVLTRGSRDALYNTAAGETSPKSTSPADTLWAFGSLANFSTLTYQSLESLRDGNLAARILNQPMVVHLVKEDIYLSLKFTTWGTHGAGGFAYTRSTPAVAAAPTVNITSPIAGAVFTAPATVELTCSATVTGGAVTNVQFFSGTALLGAADSSPFSLTLSNLAAGDYLLTAVATASGISSTSAVVNISVVAPVAVALSLPAASNGLFSFGYNADPGTSYVVERSANLLDWTPVVTNVASSNPATFSEPLVSDVPNFYRVERLTGP